MSYLRTLGSLSVYHRAGAKHSGVGRVLYTTGVEENVTRRFAFQKENHCYHDDITTAKHRWKQRIAHAGYFRCN
jgi:hypothetical protein